jgi:hypothetical protein
MLRRLWGKLTFANLAAGAALVISLTGGTTLALSAGSFSKGVDPALNCRTDGVLVIQRGANRVVCRVGSLLVRAVCDDPPTGDVAGLVRLSTSEDHAFAASEWFRYNEDADFNVGERGVIVTSAGPHNSEEWQVNYGTFAASEAPESGGRHLGGTVMVRSRQTDSPAGGTCEFAVDALTG